MLLEPFTAVDKDGVARQMACQDNRMDIIQLPVYSISSHFSLQGRFTLMHRYETVPKIFQRLLRFAVGIAGGLLLVPMAPISSISLLS